MTALVVEEAGPATSVQDAGRFGGQRYGLGPSGAMDRYALAVANALVGQPGGAAAVEIGPLGARFTAKGGAVRVSLSGADRAAAVGDKTIRIGESVLIEDGQTLAVKAARGGVFSYLGIEGGIRSEPMMGSHSVHMRAGLGSPYTRPLKAGDELPVSGSKAGRERFIAPQKAASGPIRVVLGPQDDHFTPASIEAFLASDWTISATSDRMGYRLEGPKLVHGEKGANIVSDGIANGHIQVPGNGQPLVLLAERGTTGGYPKIATIITADLARFAQTPPGTSFRFRAVSVEEAQDEARRYLAEIEALPDRMSDLAVEFTTDMLIGANLAGRAISALDPDTWCASGQDVLEEA